MDAPSGRVFNIALTCPDQECYFHCQTFLCNHRVNHQYSHLIDQSSGLSTLGFCPTARKSQQDSVKAEENLHSVRG